MISKFNPELIDIASGVEKEAGIKEGEIEGLLPENVLENRIQEIEKYIENLDKDTCSSIGYIYVSSMNALRKIDEYKTSLLIFKFTNPGLQDSHFENTFLSSIK